MQQNSLTEKAPEVEGLDIASRIIYNDNIGSDFYDYIYNCNPACHKIGIVVGDVSEHSISSALHIESTRAFIRQRAALPGSVASIVTDVNFQFSRDVEDSGRFMTLFFLTVETEKNTLEWVRAGHEPATFYDPSTNTFEKLKGNGIALGIDGNYQYQGYERKFFDAGQIVILATNGLWEAKNSIGEMLGKKRIKEIIKENCDKSASKILNCRVLPILSTPLKLI